MWDEAEVGHELKLWTNATDWTGPAEMGFAEVCEES